MIKRTRDQNLGCLGRNWY